MTAAAPVLHSNDLDSIADELCACRADPELFVDTMFDWNSGELKGKQPEPWQREVLRGIRDGLPNKAIRIAVASGHGVGKTCLVSWLCLWANVYVHRLQGRAHRQQRGTACNPQQK
jgi:hypothetical protein